MITNGVIYSDSLEIRSTMMRLEYAGTLDLKQNVNAHVTAQLLRDTWVVGPLVSTVLWPVSKLFEYHITGTLKNPKSEPVYVLPKFLLMPLHPIRTLEESSPAATPFPAGQRVESNAMTESVLRVSRPPEPHSRPAPGSEAGWWKLPGFVGWLSRRPWLLCQPQFVRAFSSASTSLSASLLSSDSA